MDQDRCAGELGLETRQRCLSLMGPADCLRGDVRLVRGVYHLNVTPGKPLIKVGKAQEKLEMFSGRESGPLQYGARLHQVQRELLLLNYESQEVDKGDRKLALLNLHTACSPEGIVPKKCAVCVSLKSQMMSMSSI